MIAESSLNTVGMRTFGGGLRVLNLANQKKWKVSLKKPPATPQTNPPPHIWLRHKLMHSAVGREPQKAINAEIPRFSDCPWQKLKRQESLRVLRKCAMRSPRLPNLARIAFAFRFYYFLSRAIFLSLNAISIQSLSFPVSYCIVLCQCFSHTWSLLHCRTIFL